MILGWVVNVIDITSQSIMIIYMRILLKKIIEDKGYNQHQVAKALGFHKTTLYNHVKNRTDLGIGKARKLAVFLGITLEEVYNDN